MDGRIEAAFRASWMESHASYEEMKKGLVEIRFPYEVSQATDFYMAYYGASKKEIEETHDEYYYVKDGDDYVYLKIDWNKLGIPLKANSFVTKEMAKRWGCEV